MVTNRDRKYHLEIPKIAQTTGTVDVFGPGLGISGPLRGELPHVHICMNDEPNPLTWDAQLLSYWFSRNQAGRLPRLAREFDQ